MTKFEEFSKEFKESYESIYEFIDESDSEKELIAGGKLIENLDVEAYDSYGSEDSTLERVFYFEKYDIHVKFEGTRCSYRGEEWDEYNEVKKQLKTITVWE